MAGFHILYDKYAPVLMGCIHRIVNNHNVAESVLVKTYVHIWDQQASFYPEDAAVLSRMMGIARKLAFEEIKANPGLQQDFTGSNQKEADSKSAINPEEQQNRVFNLLYHRGINSEHAASLLNITVEEVKSHLRMAVKNLKNKEQC